MSESPKKPTPPNWVGKICPYLTAAALNQQQQSAQSLLISAGGVPASGGRAPELEMLSCHGPQCAMFIVTRGDEQGRPTQGECCFALLPSLMVGLREAVGQSAQALAASGLQIQPAVLKE